MKIFNINNAQSRTQIRDRQNQTTGVQTEQKLERRFLKEMTKPEMDTVSFKGNIVHGINSSRKWVDYGDIFKEGADWTKQKLPKARTILAKLNNANLRGAILTWNTAQNVNLDNATYDQFTVFNHGFNPNAHNMFFEESSLAYYGIK